MGGRFTNRSRIERISRLTWTKVVEAEIGVRYITRKVPMMENVQRQAGGMIVAETFRRKQVRAHLTISPKTRQDHGLNFTTSLNDFLDRLDRSYQDGLCSPNGGPARLF